MFTTQELEEIQADYEIGICPPTAAEELYLAWKFDQQVRQTEALQAAEAKREELSWKQDYLKRQATKAIQAETKRQEAKVQADIIAERLTPDNLVLLEAITWELHHAKLDAQENDDELLREVYEARVQKYQKQINKLLGY